MSNDWSAIPTIGEQAMTCDICDSPDFVGVAAVPGFPVSLAWCKHCLTHYALPLFCVEVTLCDFDMGPDDPDGRMLTLRETIKKHGLDKVLSGGADWFMQSEVYIHADFDSDVPNKPPCEGPGYYLTVADYVRKCAEPCQQPA